MSTGENLNANGAIMTAEMIRGGIHRFPESLMVHINQAAFDALSPIEHSLDDFFMIVVDNEVPPGEIWFKGRLGHILGRIVHCKHKAKSATLVITKFEAASAVLVITPN